MKHVAIDHRPLLDAYAEVPHLAPHVHELRAEARLIAPVLAGRRVWMVNSTAQGGGVAEMLPAMIEVLRELGVDVRWSVIESDEPAFFPLTKRLHNLIHGVGEPRLDAEARALYERVNRQNADALRPELRPEDILVVHDPQPLGMGAMLKEELGLPAVWRCHIGLDRVTPATEEAWSFLKPWARVYDHVVFSAPEYIPGFLTHCALVVMPALDPFSHKNRELSPHKLMGVLCNAALALEIHPVLTPDFAAPARRVRPDGSATPANVPDDIGVMYRPIITQVSRWDRLKGFAPLLEAFAALKTDATQHPPSAPRHQRRLAITRLVLAGPDPTGIQDDPGGREVLDDLVARFRRLPPAVQDDVAIVLLPMSNKKENALMVNALQRCSTLVVQNSLQEGFGLTATEAMWKRVPVVASSACGLRHQIRDGLDGVLVKDPEDTHALATVLEDALSNPWRRASWAQSAQRRAHDEFLLFRQLRQWLELLRQCAGG